MSECRRNPGFPFEVTDDDRVCEHGTAMDVHCCNCHSGFLFDRDSCVCTVGGPNDGGEVVDDESEERAA